MRHKMKQAFMDTAHRFAELSTAKRLQVGAIVVKDDRIISIGYNGTPAGWDNNCEYKDYMPEDASQLLSDEQILEQYPYEEMEFPGDSVSEKLKTRTPRRYALKTRPEVLHAERNSLDKLAKGHESGENASIFITHSPCLECAKSIYGSGITEVFYHNDYRSDDGINFLKQCGIKVEKLED